jgi:hypothetical protein
LACSAAACFSAACSASRACRRPIAPQEGGPQGLRRAAAACSLQHGRKGFRAHVLGLRIRRGLGRTPNPFLCPVLPNAALELPFRCSTGSHPSSSGQGARRISLPGPPVVPQSCRHRQTDRQTDRQTERVPLRCPPFSRHLERLESAERAQHGDPAAAQHPRLRPTCQLHQRLQSDTRTHALKPSSRPARLEEDKTRRCGTRSP